VLSVAGALISLYLLTKHFDKSDKDDLFASVCEATGGGCEEVLESRWAYFPPLSAEEIEAARAGAPATQAAPQTATQSAEPDAAGQAPATQSAGASPTPAKRLRVPVALLGAIYFSVLAVWFVAIGRVSPARRVWHWAPLGSVSLGLLGSFGFIYVMMTELDAWCPWCLACHVANFAIFVLMVLAYPRRAPAGGAESQGAHSTVGAGAQTSVVESLHPSSRLVGVTGLAIGGVALAVICFANWLGWQSRARNLDRQNREYKRVVADYLEDGVAMFRTYQGNPKHDLTDRPGSHVRGGGTHPLHTVIFADFECPHCREVSEFLEQKVQPLFRNSMRIVFKHYPLCSDCNPHVKTKVHPHACEAGRAAEAACLQGGNDAFWKAHDKLFADQRNLRGYDYGEFATALGLDRDRLLKDMESELVAARISDDIELAKSLNIEATPRVFVLGREVPAIAVKQMPFWETLAQAYRAEINKREQNRARATSPHG